MSSPKSSGILITTGIFPPDIGGPASYSETLARKLSDNFSVTLITYSSKIKYARDKSLPFKVIRVWKKVPKPLRHLIFFLRTLAVAKNFDRILSLNAVSAGVPAMLASKVLKKKFWVKVVGDYAWETAANFQKTQLLIDDFQKSQRRGKIGILHRLQSWVCKNADGIIVPSNYLAGMVAGWGVQPEKIKVVYNGVAGNTNELNQEEARNKIGIHGNIILSVGRLVPWKGFRMLIKIMPQLLSINQFFRLVIVGSGPEQKPLEAMVKNLGLHNKVHLVGKKSREELENFMAGSEMFILNTGYEGFSHQIIEVMAAGLPVITTAVGGNKEIVNQGENGFMVKYNDEFNLIEAIKTLWQVPEMKTRFIDEGRKTAEHFNDEKMFEETVKILMG